jgi:hypothetical protein
MKNIALARIKILKGETVTIYIAGPMGKGANLSIPGPGRIAIIRHTEEKNAEQTIVS